MEIKIIMKKKLITLFVICLLALSMLGCSQQSVTQEETSATISADVNTENTGENISYGAQGAKTEQNINIEKMLAYSIQDEYLAYAEYEYILETFSNPKPFSNIINAEKKHIELLTPLFDNYNYQAPANTAKDHLLYSESLEDAFKTGVQVEIENIAMYEAFLKEELPDDIKAVFQELKAGSENHLAAFEKKL